MSPCLKMVLILAVVSNFCCFHALAQSPQPLVTTVHPTCGQLPAVELLPPSNPTKVPAHIDPTFIEIPSIKTVPEGHNHVEYKTEAPLGTYMLSLTIIRYVAAILGLALTYPYLSTTVKPYLSRTIQAFIKALSTLLGFGVLTYLLVTSTAVSTSLSVLKNKLILPIEVDSLIPPSGLTLISFIGYMLFLLPLVQTCGHLIAPLVRAICKVIRHGAKSTIAWLNGEPRSHGIGGRPGHSLCPHCGISAVPFGTTALDHPKVVKAYRMLFPPVDSVDVEDLLSLQQHFNQTKAGDNLKSYALTLDSSIVPGLQESSLSSKPIYRVVESQVPGQLILERMANPVLELCHEEDFDFTFIPQVKTMPVIGTDASQLSLKDLIEGGKYTEEEIENILLNRRREKRRINREPMPISPEIWEKFESINNLRHYLFENSGRERLYSQKGDIPIPAEWRNLNLFQLNQKVRQWREEEWRRYLETKGIKSKFCEDCRRYVPVEGHKCLTNVGEAVQYQKHIPHRVHLQVSTQGTKVVTKKQAIPDLDIMEENMKKVLLNYPHKSSQGEEESRQPNPEEEIFRRRTGNDRSSRRRRGLAHSFDRKGQEAPAIETPRDLPDVEMGAEKENPLLSVQGQVQHLTKRVKGTPRTYATAKVDARRVRKLTQKRPQPQSQAAVALEGPLIEAAINLSDKSLVVLRDKLLSKKHLWTSVSK
jgi:hypothetical protein